MCSSQRELVEATHAFENNGSLTTWVIFYGETHHTWFIFSLGFETWTTCTVSSHSIVA